MRYDIAIIGTGPAGLSAAVTAKIRNKSVLLIGSKDLSPKVTKAHAIQNYLGLPNIPGADLGAAFQASLDAVGVAVTEDKITAAYNLGDYYGLQGAETIYEASTLILATGMIPGKLLPGEEALLGRGVSYCATCDAALYRGKTVAVIGYSPKEEHEAAFLSEIAACVNYFPMYKELESLPESVRVIREKPLEIRQENGLRQVVTAENTYGFDGVFILRDSISPGQLVPGLEIENNHVKVDRSMATNLPGCFACGDVVGLPYQYIKSAGEGNVAALSAAAYLDMKKREA